MLLYIHVPCLRASLRLHSSRPLGRGVDVQLPAVRDYVDTLFLNWPTGATSLWQRSTVCLFYGGRPACFRRASSAYLYGAH